MTVLKSLALKNFRSYKEASFSFAEGINSIEGDNGQGKTNLLEAIFLLSVGRSFRTHHLQELVRHGTKGFCIEALFERDGIDQRLTIQFASGEKKLFHNDTSHSHFSSLLGLIPQTLAAPSDIALIIGAPQERRRLLNFHIAQVDSLYAFHLTRYAKALGHRNALLKEQRLHTIDIWEEEMAKSAGYLVEARKKLLEELSLRMRPYYASLIPVIEEVELRYHPSLDGDFQRHWKATRKRELECKTTLSGPHRDDFTILREGKNAKTYASEGQKRSLIAALKLAEFARLQERSETSPFLSIDDFGVHLDLERKALFQKELAHKGQVFLTTPTALDVLGTHIRLARGETPSCPCAG